MRETDAYTMVSLSSPVSTNYTNKSTKRLKGRVFFTNTDNVDIMFCLFLHIINIQNTIPIPKVISYAPNDRRTLGWPSLEAGTEMSQI